LLQLLWLLRKDAELAARARALSAIPESHRRGECEAEMQLSVLNAIAV
jgi:hypothetical protein